MNKSDDEYFGHWLDEFRKLVSGYSIGSHPCSGIAIEYIWWERIAILIGTLQAEKSVTWSQAIAIGVGRRSIHASYPHCFGSTTVSAVSSLSEVADIAGLISVTERFDTDDYQLRSTNLLSADRCTQDRVESEFGAPSRKIFQGSILGTLSYADHRDSKAWLHFDFCEQGESLVLQRIRRGVDVLKERLDI
jgi:hypothetical protein